jgi:hypothetical protein
LCTSIGPSHHLDDSVVRIEQQSNPQCRPSVAVLRRTKGSLWSHHHRNYNCRRRTVATTTTTTTAAMKIRMTLLTLGRRHPQRHGESGGNSCGRWYWSKTNRMEHKHLFCPVVVLFRDTIKWPIKYVSHIFTTHMVRLVVVVIVWIFQSIRRF